MKKESIDKLQTIYTSQGRRFYGGVFHGDYYYDCDSQTSNNDIGNRIENPKYKKMRLFDALKDEKRREFFTSLIVFWKDVKDGIVCKKTHVSQIENFQV